MLYDGDFAKRVAVFGHRGARAFAPENMLVGFEEGVAQGSDGVEFDCQITKDGKIVVTHDPFLTRTSNVLEHPELADGKVLPLRICDLTFAELQTLDFGKFFVETDPYKQIAEGHVSEERQRDFIGTRISLLEDVLSWIAEKGLAANVEIKDQQHLVHHAEVSRLILDCVMRSKAREQVIISSFQHAYLREIRTYMPEMPLGVLVEGVRVDDPVALCREIGAVAFHPGRDIITKKDIEYLRTEGFFVNIWTLNSEAELAVFRDWGATGLISDYPARAKRVVGR